MKRPIFFTLLYFFLIPIGFLITCEIQEQLRRFSAASLPNEVYLPFCGESILVGLFLLSMVLINNYVARTWKPGKYIILGTTILNLSVTLLPIAEISPRIGSFSLVYFQSSVYVLIICVLFVFSFAIFIKNLGGKS